MASLAHALGAHEPLRQPELALLARQLFVLPALLRGDERWLLSDGEANAIAEPAARLLARHTLAQRLIRAYTDPVVLASVVGAIVRSRFARRAPTTTPAVAARPAPVAPAPVAPPSPAPVPSSAPAQETPHVVAAAVLDDVLATIASIP